MIFSFRVARNVMEKTADEADCSATQYTQNMALVYGKLGLPTLSHAIVISDSGMPAILCITCRPFSNHVTCR